MLIILYVLYELLLQCIRTPPSPQSIHHGILPAICHELSRQMLFRVHAFPMEGKLANIHARPIMTLDWFVDLRNACSSLGNALHFWLRVVMFQGPIRYGR